MTNQVYRKAVEALEEVMSPRVVSRSLQEGLKHIGKQPDTVDLADMETILKEQVYRQLQVSMPVNEAKETVVAILERLASGDSEIVAPEPPFDPERQRAALGKLQASLRPFNLYFEWPETQKLRSQLRLIESELNQGRDAAKLLADAGAEFRQLEQKLEDHLVSQARELGELEAAFERVKTLGGPKVRRLDNLLGQVRAAQRDRQLAGAELERARKLLTELRKLLESSVISEEDGAGDESAQDTALPVDVTNRLRLLDLESERHELDAMASEFAVLCDYQPGQAEVIARLREQLERQESIGDRLAQTRVELVAAREALKRELHADLTRLKESLAESDPGGDEDGKAAGEARHGVEVALGVLETTLPSYADVQHLRSLGRWLEERWSRQQSASGEQADDDGVLASQWAELASIERQAGPFLKLDYAGVPALREVMAAARRRLETGQGADELSRAKEFLDSIREAHEQALEGFEARLDAALRAFEPLSRLNSEESAATARTLAHLSGQRDALQRVSPAVQCELVAALEQAETSIEELKLQLDATREVAGRLVEGGVLDDILGLFEAPASDSPGGTGAAPDNNELGDLLLVEAEADRSDGSDPELERQLAGLLQTRGVTGAATLARGHVIAGRLPLDTDRLCSGTVQFGQDLAALGKGLDVGAMRLATVETGDALLIVAWPTPEHQVAVLVGTPTHVGPVLDKLRSDLPHLSGLLYQNA